METIDRIIKDFYKKKKLKNVKLIIHTAYKNYDMGNFKSIEKAKEYADNMGEWSYVEGKKLKVKHHTIIQNGKSKTYWEKEYSSNIKNRICLIKDTINK
tara:strand:+ start:1502 stop:1798 length:297 start_codon:yes stop_codon:yes gene_type:complete